MRVRTDAKLGGTAVRDYRPGSSILFPGLLFCPETGSNDKKETDIMKTIQISDVTLRKAEAASLSFKERVEIARPAGPFSFNYRNAGLALINVV